MTEVNSIHHQSIELVERFGQCLLKNCKNNSEVALVRQLAPYITYFNNEIQMNIKQDEIFENYVSMIENATEKPDCDDILNEYQQKISKAREEIENSEECEKYTSFMEMISEVNINNDDDDDDDNCEIKTVSETVSTIDPISKLPIVDPVKNKKCGHSYEKSTILKLIKKNRKTRCPIAGCSAMDYVKESDLVPDMALKRILSAGSSNPHKKSRTS